MSNAQCAMAELAPLASAGALDAREAAEFTAHVTSCEICAAELRSFDETAALLAVTIAQAPPPSLRSKLLSRFGPPAASLALVRSGQGKWIRTPYPGVEIKRLFSDPQTGMLVSLLRVEAGGSYPSHRHAGAEQTYVLEGDVVFDDHTLYAGDYEVAAPSTKHSIVRTNTGCMVLLINHKADEVLPDEPGSVESHPGH
jgi:anti-sigma factor ChrR (cupin superfamily)